MDMSLKEVSSRSKELVREFDREGSLLAQLASLTYPDEYDTTYLTHGIHPYPAKYIPQLPNLIIREHTDERNVVLDPFCGSGTTLLEAMLLGRKSVGVDSNAVAALISSAKTGLLSDDELAIATEFAQEVRQLNVPRKYVEPHGATDVNLFHWFEKHVSAELVALRLEIESRTQLMPALRSFLRCIFSSIIVSVSNQESETRYAAISKNIPERDVFKRFSKKLERELARVQELTQLAKPHRVPAKVFHSDIRKLSNIGLRENSIDLVVTSPPYPNSFDYYLYHKWRLFWLGYDFRTVMAEEIGSRNEHSSRKQPIEAYITKMRDALLPISYTLKPSKLAYFFVGDAVIGGEFHDISRVFEEIIKGTDLRMVADTNYSLEKVTRSFHEKTSENCHGGRRNYQKRQHILVFEKINRGRISVTGVRTQATPKPDSLPVELTKMPIADGAVIALKSDDDQRHVHSVGRYPSKFIPEIPRWAITEYCPEGGLVLDPFGGSGTTAVEAVLAGRRALSSDVSPYSVLLSKAKTCWVDPNKLKRMTQRFLDEIQGGFPSGRAKFPRFELDDFWFPTGYLDEFASAVGYVKRHAPSCVQNILLAAISTAVRPCSYQDEGQIKVKRDPKKVLTGTPSPSVLMPAMVERVIQKKLEFLEKLPTRPDILIKEMSAERIIQDKLVQKNSVDLIVTSPPYINAMNYPMTHRYENIVLGLFHPEEKTEHERVYFGSERVYSAEYATLKHADWHFSRVAELNAALENIYKGEPKRSFITFRFFSLMQKALIEQYNCLKPGGRLVIVVRRNTIKGVPVDTFGFLMSMAEAIGFKRLLHFEYEIIKNAFKLTRHATADIIKTDGVAVLGKE